MRTRPLALLGLAFLTLIFQLAAQQPTPKPVVPLEDLESAQTQSPATTVTPLPAAQPTPLAVTRPTPLPEAQPAQPTPAPAGVVAKTPAAQAPQATAELEKIIVTRVKAYRNASAQAQTQAVSPAGSGQLYVAPEQPGMVVQIRLLAPKGWTIVSIDSADLSHALDQSGKELRVTPAASPAPDGPGTGFNMVSPSSELGSMPVVSLAAQVPPRSDDVLKEIAAAFKITLGQNVRQQYKNLRAYKGKELPNIPVPGLKLVVDEVGDDVVVLRALGKVDQLGSLQLVAVNGQPLMPYAQEAMIDANEEAVQVQRTWRLSFAKLPEMIHLNMTAYPVMTEQAVQFQQGQVPLP